MHPALIIQLAKFRERELAHQAAHGRTPPRRHHRLRVRSGR
jgi:hypothetical protein